MKKGFTLLELAIVLIIIALIAGGISYAKSLITASKLQTVVTDVDSYATAVGNFQQAYQGLPGDFTNAQTLWGTDSGGCTNGGGTSGTCNGDGDGKLNTNGGASKVGETFLFWQHLYLAKMASKFIYNNAGAGGTYDSIPDTNVPSGSIKGSGFSAIWWGTVGVDTERFSGYYGNIIMFGKSHGTVSGATDYNITRDPILTPDQANSIDVKMDDGMPATGKVRAYVSSTIYTPNCTTTAVASTSVYNISNSGTLCSLIFVMGF